MTADTKLFHGGDTAIIFTHTQPIADDMEISQQCNEVNDLIISCKTSKESLSKLYKVGFSAESCV